MRIGLFIPCYVDAFHPDVSIATLNLSSVRRAEEACLVGGQAFGQKYSDRVQRLVRCRQVADTR